ncbi:MAG: hypothetical protein KKB13_19740 [Chloroflexi bacterium]|nr:hypothetical protein [Chloroflexota bacterium]
MTIQTMTTEQRATIQRWCQEWAAPGEEDQVPDWQALVQRALSSPRGRVLACFDDDRDGIPVGLIVYQGPLDQEALPADGADLDEDYEDRLVQEAMTALAELYRHRRDTMVDLVLVRPAARRQAVGRSLIQEVLDESALVPARLRACTAEGDPADPINEFLYHCGFLQTAGLDELDDDQPVHWVHSGSFEEEERVDLTTQIGEYAYDVITMLPAGLPLPVYRDALAYVLSESCDVVSDAQVPILWHDGHVVGWRTLDLLVTDPDTDQRVVARCLPGAAPTPADIRELQLDLQYAGAWLGRLLYFGHPDLIDYDVAMWWVDPEDLAVVRRAQERRAPTPARRQPTRARADQPLPQTVRRVN